jgi:hypothetical protein
VRGSTSRGGYGVAGNSDRHDGVRGCSDMCMVCMLQHKRYDLYASSYEGYAAYLKGEVYMNGSVHMSGPVYILGPLYKPAGLFKIVHPLGPPNKYLSHSFVVAKYEDDKI